MCPYTVSNPFLSLPQLLEPFGFCGWSVMTSTSPFLWDAGTTELTNYVKRGSACGHCLLFFVIVLMTSELHSGGPEAEAGAQTTLKPRDVEERNDSEQAGIFAWEMIPGFTGHIFKFSWNYFMTRSTHRNSLPRPADLRFLAFHLRKTNFVLAWMAVSWVVRNKN